MSEPYLSMADIETKYPNEWVLINRPMRTKYQQVLGGEVIFHSRDKAEIYAKVKDLPTPFDIATWYTGPLVAEDEEILLNVGVFL